MARNVWTDEEDCRLAELYPRAERSVLDAEFARSYGSLKTRASRMGIRRLIREERPGTTDGALSKLSWDWPISAYWNGFIFADGSYGGLHGNRLCIGLSSVDSSHLERFASWVGHGSVRTSADRASVKYGVVDHITIPELRRKFDLRPAKTYNPPGHLPYCDRTLLRSWLVGFIDGDGYLRKQTGRKTSFLQVTSHMSWMDFLRSLSDELHFGYCKTRINGVPGAEYASLNSAAHNEIVALKRFAIRHSLPFLERKWSKVDENLVLPPVWTDDIRILTRAGISPNDIARALGISVQSVYQRQYRDRKQGY